MENIDTTNLNKNNTTITNTNSNTTYTLNSNTNDSLLQAELDNIIELNKKSIELIEANEKLDQALIKLKQAEEKLERIIIDFNGNIDKKLLMVILHNISCCYQKLKDNENCTTYLDAVIYHLESLLILKYNISFSNQKINLEPSEINLGLMEKQEFNARGDLILELRYLAKFNLQMCAVLSQSGKHKEALINSHKAEYICEDNLFKTKELLKLYKELKLLKKEDFEGKEIIKLSDIENIINHICIKINIFKYTNNNLKNTISKDENHMEFDEQINNINKNINESVKCLYFENPNEDWLKNLNIGNIMYLTSLSIEEFDLESDPFCELQKDAIIEKIIMLSVSYFSLATEYKFLSELTDDKNEKNEKFNKSEAYHSIAVEISFCYLQSLSPIIKHYLNTYNKNYNLSLSPIKEDYIKEYKIDLINSFGLYNQFEFPFIRKKKIKEYKYIENEYIQKIKAIKNAHITINNGYSNTRNSSKSSNSKKSKGNIENSKSNISLNKKGVFKNKVLNEILTSKSYSSEKQTTSRPSSGISCRVGSLDNNKDKKNINKLNNINIRPLSKLSINLSRESSNNKIQSNEIKNGRLDINNNNKPIDHVEVKELSIKSVEDKIKSIKTMKDKIIIPIKTSSPKKKISIPIINRTSNPKVLYKNNITINSLISNRKETITNNQNNKQFKSLNNVENLMSTFKNILKK